MAAVLSEVLAAAFSRQESDYRAAEVPSCLSLTKRASDVPRITRASR